MPGNARTEILFDDGGILEIYHVDDVPIFVLFSSLIYCNDIKPGYDLIIVFDNPRSTDFWNHIRAHGATEVAKWLRAAYCAGTHVGRRPAQLDSVRSTAPWWA
jgi:hypothetical protein